MFGEEVDDGGAGEVRAIAQVEMCEASGTWDGVERCVCDARMGDIQMC